MHNASRINPYVKPLRAASKIGSLYSSFYVTRGKTESKPSNNQVFVSALCVVCRFRLINNTFNARAKALMVIDLTYRICVRYRVFFGTQAEVI